MFKTNSIQYCMEIIISTNLSVDETVFFCFNQMQLTSHFCLNFSSAIMIANHRIELAKYWLKIDGETKSSLRQINSNSTALLDTIFKDEFLRMTMTRYLISVFRLMINALKYSYSFLY